MPSPTLRTFRAGPVEKNTLYLTPAPVNFFGVLTPSRPLCMLKQKKRRLEEEQQALDAKIEEQKARVLAKI